MGDMRGGNGVFTPEVTAILLHYLMHVDKLDIELAIKKIDDMERYIMANRHA